MKIEQIYVSNDLKTNIPCNPSLISYHNNSIPSFFCGLSNDEDIKCLESHASYKIIIWHTINEKIIAKVKSIEQVYNLTLCDTASQVLQEHGIVHVNFPLNTNNIPDELLDTTKVKSIEQDYNLPSCDTASQVLQEHDIVHVNFPLNTNNIPNELLDTAKVKSIEQDDNLPSCDTASQVLQEHDIVHVNFPLNTNNIPDELLDTMFFEHDVNYYFDKIIIINLDRDVTKWNRMKTLLSKHKINNYIRFSATDGNEEPYLTEWNMSKYKHKMTSPAVLGHLYSVLNVAQYCSKMGYKRFLFLEDDVIFVKNFSSDFRRMMANINGVPWKLLYLGANDVVQPKAINNLYHPRVNICGSFATGIDSSVYQCIINVCLKKNMPADTGAFNYVIRMAQKNTFVVYPNLIIADVSKSSLRGPRDMIKFAKTRHWILEDYDLGNE